MDRTKNYLVRIKNYLVLTRAPTLAVLKKHFVSSPQNQSKKKGPQTDPKKWPPDNKKFTQYHCESKNRDNGAATSAFVFVTTLTFFFFRRFRRLIGTYKKDTDEEVPSSTGQYGKRGRGFFQEG